MKTFSLSMHVLPIIHLLDWVIPEKIYGEKKKNNSDTCGVWMRVNRLFKIYFCKSFSAEWPKRSNWTLKFSTCYFLNCPPDSPTLGHFFSLSFFLSFYAISSVIHDFYRHYWWIVHSLTSKCQQECQAKWNFFLTFDINTCHPHPACVRNYFFNFTFNYITAIRSSY